MTSTTLSELKKEVQPEFSEKFMQEHVIMPKLKQYYLDTDDGTKFIIRDSKNEIVEFTKDKIDADELATLVRHYPRSVFLFMVRKKTMIISDVISFQDRVLENATYGERLNLIDLSDYKNIVSILNYDNFTNVSVCRRLDERGLQCTKLEIKPIYSLISIGILQFVPKRKHNDRNIQNGGNNNDNNKRKRGINDESDDDDDEREENDGGNHHHHQDVPTKKIKTETGEIVTNNKKEATAAAVNEKVINLHLLCEKVQDVNSQYKYTVVGLGKLKKNSDNLVVSRLIDEANIELVEIPDSIRQMKISIFDKWVTVSTDGTFTQNKQLQLPIVTLKEIQGFYNDNDYISSLQQKTRNRLTKKTNNVLSEVPMLLLLLELLVGKQMSKAELYRHIQELQFGDCFIYKKQKIQLNRQKKAKQSSLSEKLGPNIHELLSTPQKYVSSKCDANMKRLCSTLMGKDFSKHEKFPLIVDAIEKLSKNKKQCKENVALLKETLKKMTSY